MADKTFRLEIIAPDRIFYSNDIYMVEYNTVEGEVGIYADHIPMTQIMAGSSLPKGMRRNRLHFFPALWRSLLKR